ncbi:amidase [Blastococcus sp. Marseille-P5729]|uniref:amidase n=1 Tax=Blastococcus sp. Marseille-P5729 TaxID=2086582 RepID=UPI000D0F9744|nr:amidase [Blastococcus sp. Marseille-P5729]
MTDIPCMPATTLAKALRSGQISSREATEAFIARIERVNPRVNAVVTLVAEQALEAARAADEYAVSNDDLPPLHGMPMLHKDTHATAGIRTTSGSPLLADNVPTSDDLVISRLRHAGVISLGKTNTPEFAAGSHTFNPVFGPTHNPYDLARSAGGSSGGAAAALATGMIALADGSDMGGSLRNPASFCNVVGLRPSPGRVPNAPDAFGQLTLSTSGPMARSVDDLALLLSVMAGPDLRAPASLDTPGTGFAPVREIDPARLRVAVAADFGGMMPIEPEVVDIVTRAGETFEALGASVERAMPDLTHADEVFGIRRAWQFAANLGPVVNLHPDQVKEAIRWNVEKGRALSVDDLTRALVWGEQLYQRVVQFFEQYDVLLVPAAQVVPFDIGIEYPAEINGRPMHTYLEWMRACSDITATGTPAISVPGGFTDAGLPVGVQMVAAPRADALLLSIARTFEQATGHAQRRPPVLDGEPLS